MAAQDVIDALALLEENTRAFIARGSGLESNRVLEGNQKGPRPKQAYATVLFRNDPRLGYPIRGEAENGESQDISHRRAAFSVQFFRNGASGRALAFCLYAESENGLTDAEDLNIRIVQPVSYERLDVPAGDAFEHRALINLELDHYFVTDQDAGEIDSITGGIDYGELEITPEIPAIP